MRLRAPVSDGDDSGHPVAPAPTGKRSRARELTPVQRALGLLTRREHSRRELIRKLSTRGVEKEQALAAVDRLSQAGWQDDLRFAESLARTRAASGFGPLHIRAELGMHALKPEYVEAALAACGTDWSEAALSLVSRRFSKIALNDVRDRRKAIDFLLRRGFSRADAFGAVKYAGDAYPADSGDDDEY